MSDLHERIATGKFGQKEYAELKEILRPALKKWNAAFGADIYDLEQDVIVEIWQRTTEQQYDGRGSFAGYARMIANSRLTDRYRSSIVRQNQKERMCTESRTYEERKNVDIALDLQTALECIDPACREVLELAYFHDLTQQEISTRLQKPLGTVKTWSRTGKQQLRQALGNGGGYRP